MGVRDLGCRFVGGERRLGDILMLGGCAAWIIRGLWRELVSGVDRR